MLKGFKVTDIGNKYSRKSHELKSMEEDGKLIILGFTPSAIFKILHMFQTLTIRNFVID